MQWLHSLTEQLFGLKTTRTARRLARKKSRRPDWRSSAPRLEELESRLALSVSMVTDLNAYSQDSNPANFTNVNGTVFFTANTPAGDPDYDGDTELFKTDGTPPGTTMLTPGGDEQVTNFQSNSLVNFNNKLFFVAEDSAIGGFQTLMTSDGTAAGTAPFLVGGNALYSPTHVTVVGNKLFFLAYNGLNANSHDLWVSNGTSAGTHPVGPSSANLPTGDYSTDFASVNGKLYFNSYDTTTSKYDLWVSDGTAGGTSILAEFDGSHEPNNITAGAAGNHLYFEEYDASASKYALWKSDGTSGGTSQVADISANQFYSPTELGTKLYFQVSDSTDAPNTGWALWSSDGTAANTGAFKYGGGVTAVQVNQNTPTAVMGSNLYFDGYDTTHSYSLWKTDGVSANNNTATVQANGSNPFNYNAYQLAVAGSELYFVAGNSNDGGNYNLWKTDGTSANTAPVQSSGNARGITQLTVSGSKVFFSAYNVDSHGNSVYGNEPWVSDGTNGGTQMIADINTTTYGSNPRTLTAVGSEIFFDADTYSPVNGTYLWQSDGTATNTLPVQTSTGTVPTTQENSTAVGNTLFFTAYGSNGYDLWTSGTGTKSAVEMFPTGTNPFNGSFASGDGTSFVNLNGTLYFGAVDRATNKWALWQSNGTPAGTKVVQDLSASYAMSHLTAVGSDLFWQQYDPTNSTYALWEYNGTTASQVQDISANGLNHLTAVGGNVFFYAYDSGTSKYALWASNGTTTTNLLELNNNQFQSLTSFDGKLFFGAYVTAQSNWVLWSSDGTVAGTTQFFGDNGQPVYVSSSPDLTVEGSELYGDFLSIGGQQMLGKTDGTAAGTVVVQEQHVGNGAALDISNISASNIPGTIVFDANDSYYNASGNSTTHGYELWQSDGTDAGTLLVDDIVPGTGSSSAQYMTLAGNQVFFNANDVLHGSELWTATLSSTVVTAGISGPNDGVTEQHRDYVLTASDSNSGNNSAGFSFAVNWGDDTSETVSGLSGLTADHQYASTGNFTIKVTATNLADGVASAPAQQIVTITSTEMQNGNLAIGGLPGNNAWSITHGIKSTNYTVKDNATPIYPNFTPATGSQIFLYGGNGTNTYAATDALSTGGALVTADKFTVGPGYVSFVKPVFVGSQPGAWTVTGNNGKDTFTVSGAANASLVGGTSINTFIMSAGASLSGTLNGGSGLGNTLSYAAYGTSSSGVVVDLLLGQTTAIDGFAPGGLSGIENVTGSKFGLDILVGDANPNILITNAGHNIIIGGASGGDTLTSKKGSDILIAGTTSYDSNIAALQFILGEWKTSTASNYSTVISNIMTSGTDPLNTSTVTDSGASDKADTVTSSGQASGDWLFVHTSGGSAPNDTVNSLGSGDREDNI